MSTNSTFYSRIAVLLLLVVTGCGESASTDTDEATEKPAAAVETTNANCPIMGGAVSAEAATVEWDGKTIGFCCDGCDKKFLALSDAEKAEKLAAADAKDSTDTEGDGDESDAADQS